MDLIRSLAMHLYDRILALAKSISPGTIQLSGILGLVIAIIGYYHLKGNNASDSPDRRAARGGQQRGGVGTTTAAGGEPSTSRPQTPHGGGTSAASASAPSNPSSRPAAAPAAAAAAARGSAVARAVATRLHGVRRVTVSCQGVLLQPGALSESATLWPGAAEMVQVRSGGGARLVPCGAPRKSAV